MARASLLSSIPHAPLSQRNDINTFPRLVLTPPTPLALGFSLGLRGGVSLGMSAIGDAAVGGGGREALGWAWRSSWGSRGERSSLWGAEGSPCCARASPQNKRRSWR